MRGEGGKKENGRAQGLRRGGGGGGRNDSDALNLRPQPLPSSLSPVMAVLDHHHPGLSDKVNCLYTLSEAWCTSESDRDFAALERAVADLSPEDFILCVFLFFSVDWRESGQWAPARRVNAFFPVTHTPACVLH